MGKSHSAGAFTTHIDDILGCGEKVVTQKARVGLAPLFGVLKFRETHFNHVGLSIAQQKNYSIAQSVPG